MRKTRSLTNSPSFILVRPQMGENIGAAARAMLNFGLADLRIVNPRDGWPNPAAIDNSSGALEKINARVFNNLEDAVGDLNYLFAATARPRYIAKPVFTPEGAALEMRRRERKQKVGFVFGSERTGLENDELALCHAILSIPSNPDFPSLNLAQSAVIMAYQLRVARDKAPSGAASHTPAPQAQANEMLARLEAMLEAGNFFRTKAQKPTMRRNIRAMILRAEWSEQEVRTFQGIISALSKAEKKPG